MTARSPRRRPDAALKLMFSTVLFAYLGFVLATLLANAVWLTKPDDAGVTGISRVMANPVLRGEILAALQLSLTTSLTTVSIAVLLAIPSAYALSRFRFPFATVIDTVIDLPIVIPPLAAGLSLLLFFNQSPIGRFIEEHLFAVVYTRKGIVVAQLFIAGAFAIRVLKATFDGINPRFEAVARSLGCTPWGAFWKVALPLARNGIIAGAVMTWARAMGEFAPVLILAGGTTWPDPEHKEVLSTAVFFNLSGGNLEIAIAVTILMVLLAAGTLVGFKRLGGQGYIW